MPSELDRELDDLLVEIGNSLDWESHKMRSLRARELRARATRWLEANRDAFKRAICSQQQVRQLYHEGKTQLLFELVCEAIVHLTAGVPAGCVAAALIKRGLSKLCPELADH